MSRESNLCLGTLLLPAEVNLGLGRVTCARREPLAPEDGHFCPKMGMYAQRGPLVHGEGNLDQGRSTCAQ